MGGATQTTPGFVFYRCPRCAGPGLHLVCPNCRKSGDFRLQTRAAVCACEHRIKAFDCGCGASVAAKFFTIERTGEPRPGNQPAAVESSTLPTVYEGFKKVVSIKGQIAFVCWIAGPLIPASFGHLLGQSMVDLGTTLLMTAPMTVGVALAVRLLISDWQNDMYRILTASVILIGTAWLGILLGAISPGVKVADFFPTDLKGGLGGLVLAGFLVLKQYYVTFGAATFLTFLAVGTGLAILWKALEREY